MASCPTNKLGCRLVRRQIRRRDRQRRAPGHRARRTLDELCRLVRPDLPRMAKRVGTPTGHPVIVHDATGETLANRQLADTA